MAAMLTTLASCQFTGAGKSSPEKNKIHHGIPGDESGEKPTVNRAGKVESETDAGATGSLRHTQTSTAREAGREKSNQTGNQRGIILNQL